MADFGHFPWGLMLVLVYENLEEWVRDWRVNEGGWDEMRLDEGKETFVRFEYV